MRTTLFRWLAALVTALWLLAMGLSYRNGTVREFFSWKVIVGTVFIMPAIAVFAIGGPRPGNWLLVRCLKVMALPEYLFHKFIGSKVEVPPELREREPVPELPQPKER